jgi:hypothetical protein
MGDYMPKCFLGYLFDGEGESPSSHFDKTWTLELGFHKEDVTLEARYCWEIMDK